MRPFKANQKLANHRVKLFGNTYLPSSISIVVALWNLCL